MAENREDKRKLLDDAWESYKEHHEQESFSWIKEQYKEVRESQRKNIINYLKLKGFTVSVSPRAGQGIEKYGESRLGKSYDLRNWKWIDIEKDGQKIMLSLQPFDYDKNSGNYHALMDRLGIYLYKKNSNETSDAIKRMFLTDIDLPMDDEKLEKLENVLNGIFSCRKEMEEVYKNKKLTDENKAKSEYKEKCGKIKLYNTVNPEKTLFEQIFDIVKEGK